MRYRALEEACCTGLLAGVADARRHIPTITARSTIIAMVLVQPAFTVAEFAARANVSESLVRRAIARGDIPSFKVGGARRIPARFLAELQSCEVG